MKFVSFVTGLLSLAVLICAAPGNGHGGGNDAEAAASKQIDHLQKQYQKYIRDTIKTRQTGCTGKNILRRREWSVNAPSKQTCFLTPSQGLPLQGRPP